MANKTALNDSVFLGHPAGLGWLSGAEFWERFSYYGMQAVLVLYLTNYLLLPGHVEQIWFYEPFRAMIAALFGAHTPQAIAAGITGFYSATVYVTPLVGGWLADRFIGRTRAVLSGLALMSVGQFLLAVNQGFVLGILFLLIGVGFFKGTIASQVGDLYSQDDPRRADGFQIYFLGIQLAAIVTPLVCGTLSQKVEWHLGFVAAGVGMVFGLVAYVLGRRTLPAEPVRKEGGKDVRPPLTARDKKAVVLLVFLLPVLALALVSNQEIFVAYLVWAQKNYQLVFFGETMPVSWMISVDAFVSAFLMAGVIAFWRWWGRRWREPTELGKIIIGTVISAAAPLVLAGASAVVASTGKPVSIGWAFAFHIVNDLGFANVLPVGLALYSRAAPKGLGGVMIAVYYVHLFLGNMLIGKLGGMLGTMPDTTFWLMHAAIMTAGAAMLIVVRAFFADLIAPAYDAPTAAEAAA
ncbi:MAG TPA: oligopeptide:H+ symporter [Rhizomicrobium sp.]|nr:oligopeptide:H+ symporter [Rhizomicrobium sp.]